MTDLATLGLAIDSKPAVGAASDLDKLSRSAKGAEQSFDSLGKGATSAGTATSRMSREVATAERSMSSIRGTATAAAGGLAEFDRATISLLKAEQAGANFAATLQESFALSGKAASQSASIFEAAEREAEQFAQKVTHLRNQIDPLGAAQDRLNAELAEYAVMAERGAISATELAAAQAMARGRFEAATTALQSGSKLASHEMRNLQFQLIDIAQSIPMAFQSPLFFLQNLGFQFAQIGQNFIGRGGMSAALMEIGSLIGGLTLRFSRFIPLLGSVALGFGAIRDRASEAQGSAVGFGETAVAIFQEVGAAIRSQFGTAIDAVGSTIDYVLGNLGSAAVDIAELVINSFRAAFTDIEFVWNSFPDMLGSVFVMAANNGIDALNLLVKKSSDAVDSIISAFNSIPGVDLPTINASDQTIGKIENGFLQNLRRSVAERNEAIERIMRASPLRDFADDVADRIGTNRALDGLAALSNIDFGGTIQGVNSIGTALGGIATQAQSAGMGLRNVTQGLEDAKRGQLISMTQASQQLQTLKNQAEDFRSYLEAAGKASAEEVFGSLVSGPSAQKAIADAVSSIDKIFDAMDRGMSATQVHEALELVRASLHALGGDSRAVDQFVNSIINGELKVRELDSQVKTLSQSIAQIPNRSIDIVINEHTVRTVSGGTGTVRVQGYSPNGVINKGDGSTPLGVSGSMSLYPGGSAGDIFNSGVNVHRGSLSGFAEGGFTGHMPTDRVAGVVHGQEYVFDAEATRRIGVDNLEAIRSGVKGYQTGGSVGPAAASLMGGGNYLKNIDDHTFQTVEELKRAIGFLEVFDNTQQETLKAIRGVEKALGSVSGGRSYSGGSTRSSSGSGGFSSGGGGGVYSSNDPKSPYFYRNSTQPGGAVYDPLADAMLNGNMGALRNLGINQMGSIYTNISPGLSSQDFYADMINSLIESGPQLGTYGGGTNITADSDFLSRSGMFGSGGARPGALTDWTLNRMTARQEELMAYGPNKGTAANLKKLGFNTGGMIHPGDTREIRMFTRPDEAIGVFTPEQRQAVGDAIKGGNTDNSIRIGDIHVHVPAGSAPVDRRSQLAMRDEIFRAVREALNRP